MPQADGVRGAGALWITLTVAAVIHRSSHAPNSLTRMCVAFRGIRSSDLNGRHEKGLPRCPWA